MAPKGRNDAEVTVWPTSKGFPMASTDWPTLSFEVSPRPMKGRPLSPEILMRQGRFRGRRAYQHGFSLSAVGQADIESLDRSDDVVVREHEASDETRTPLPSVLKSSSGRLFQLVPICSARFPGVACRAK